MIRIKLSDIEKNKIKEIFKTFIDDNKILDKINDLINELGNYNCDNLKKLLLEYKEDCKLFYIFGKDNLTKFSKEYNDAIKKDGNTSGVDEEQIKKLIFEGEITEQNQKKIHAFEYYYNKFSSSDQAYEILNILNVRVCPYCNRQYTFTVKDDEVKSRPQFDHFFPKSQYPFLSISLYNLIPSCALCNCGKNRSSPEKLIYPYEDSFEDHGIYFSIVEIVPYLLKFDKTFKVLLKTNNTNENTTDIIKEYNKKYKIEILYNGHSNYVREILDKKYIFNEDALKLICKSYPTEEISVEYLKQLIFNEHEVDDFINHPLSKFTSDIIKQLKS